MPGVQHISGSKVGADFGQVFELDRPGQMQEGDQIVAILGMNRGGTPSLPTGWSMAAYHAIPGSDSAIAIVQRTVTATEPPRYEFQFAHRGWTSISAEAFRNAGPVQAIDLDVTSNAAVDVLIAPSVENGGRSMLMLAGFSSEGGNLTWEPAPLTSRRTDMGGSTTATALADGSEYRLRASHGFSGSMATVGMLVRPKTPNAEPNPPLALTFLDLPNRSDALRARELGMRQARVRFDWDELEASPGTFDAAALDQMRRIVSGFDRAGMTVLAEIDGDTPPDGTSAADFEDFCYRVALEFIPLGVRHFQLWNEPNIAERWPNPSAADYVDNCLIPGSAGVASASEETGFEAFVLFAGLAPAQDPADEDMVDFLDDAYTADAQGHFHAAAYHPRNAPDEPDFDEALGLRSAMVSAGDSELKVWITEIGWPTRDSTRHEVYPAAATSEFVSHERAAKYARRAPEDWFALGDWAGPMLWIARDDEFDNPGFTVPRSGAGLTFRNLSRKGAWFRWKREARRYRQPEPDVVTPPVDSDPNVIPTPPNFQASAVTAIEVDASWSETADATYYRLTRETWAGFGSPEPPDDPDAVPAPRPLITSASGAGQGSASVSQPVIVRSASVSLAASSQIGASGQAEFLPSATLGGVGSVAARAAGTEDGSASLAAAGTVSANAVVDADTTTFTGLADDDPWPAEWEIAFGEAYVVDGRGRLRKRPEAWASGRVRRVDGPWTDVMVYGSFVVHDVTQDTFQTIAIRSDGQGGANDYTIEYLPSDNGWELKRWVDFDDATLASHFPSSSPSNGSVIHFEFQAVGTALEVRVWFDNESRPSSANMSASDSEHNSGTVMAGINGASEDPLYVDFIEIEVDDLTT